MKLYSSKTCIAVPLMAYFLAVGCSDGPWTGRQLPTPPALLQDTQPCPTNAEPLSYAKHCEQAAKSKLARYAFQPQEGPAALELLATATQCYLKSQDPSLSQASERDFARWSRIISLDYQQLQLRLRHALLRNDKIDAAKRARQLSRLLNLHAHSTYTTWLKVLGRRSS